MLTLPKIVEREAQPYLAIAFATTMEELDKGMAERIDSFFGQLAARGETPAGPLFFRYLVIDMERELQLEIGTPTRSRLESGGGLQAGVLPAGRFVTLTYRGPYEDLLEANTVIIGWARQKGIAWDSADTPAGERFGCRLEIYHRGPESGADPEAWETEVAIRIADR